MEDAGMEIMLRMGENMSADAGSGNFIYNKDTEQFDINIDNSREFSDISRLAHELKHASQYLEGKLYFAFNKNAQKYEPSKDSYDKIDEREAFQRQQLFDSKLSDSQIELIFDKYYKKSPWSDLRVPMSGSLKRMENSMQNFGRIRGGIEPAYIYHNWKNEMNQWKGKLQ